MPGSLMPAAAPRPTLLFVHGWAFDASVWAPLRAELDGWPQAVFDAGYFGPAREPDIAGPAVAIGHSLGMLRLLRGLPQDCLGLVSLNGFPRFAAGPGFDAGVPARMLDRMARRLASDPAAVLQDFRQRCGTTAPFGAPRTEMLGRDLLALRDEDQRAALAALRVPLLVLAGGEDPIVPAPMTRAAFAACPPGDLHWRECGGHLLPVADAPWCAAHIRAFLARVAPEA
ncbi:alpha/beta fold hydrolase [Achromobacter agilis]|uniref:Aminoacrylate hydrolase RutD n=1 Tax=Achromobacter agilis TaxID=1353888 RepID=A0A446CLN6_9BURK|nr:alpha/beta hydrolase [Achromobacter agilis]SSW68802.1 Putative aminoacrylate hydrolase RutD [Achromobacter agilis]